MQSFLTGLQFLSRIRIVRQNDWSNERFSRSVRYFPLVGASVGVVMALVSYLLIFVLPFVGVTIPTAALSAILLALWLYLGGGLTCDGFMDTMDGVFSGRDREKMLVIMKDSRVGANGVVGFVMLALLKWAMLMSIPHAYIPMAFFMAAVLGKLAMVIAIVRFPYARPDGIGKMFQLCANNTTLFVAAGCTVVCLLPFGISSLICGIGAVCGTLCLGRYVTRVLGGLTGDVYGAINETIELLVLILLVFITNYR
ncbi:MAG: adenosylcobinamide-GDP ribazoletransferase [Selenomonadales bacterium]|nr:adenosylcobinamide-GDP ribazoletransferase [Selenomonadales bacterium]